MRDEFRKVFLTADVAALLGVEQWRVIKFAQGTEYQITPSHGEAAGSGSRRLYDIEDVCEMALALRLLETGLGARIIGTILKIVREKGSLEEKLKLSNDQMKHLYLLVFVSSRDGKFWIKDGSEDVLFAETLSEAQREQANRPRADSILLAVGGQFQRLRHRLNHHRKSEGE